MTDLLDMHRTGQNSSNFSGLLKFMFFLLTLKFLKISEIPPKFLKFRRPVEFKSFLIPETAFQRKFG